MSLDVQGGATPDALGALVWQMELAQPAGFGTGALVLGGMLGVSGGLLVAGGQGEIAFLGAAFLLFGLALAGFGVFKLARRSTRRGWLTVCEDGLLISRNGSDKAIPYSQVQGLYLEERRRFDDGVPAGMLRHLDFVWPGERIHVAQPSDAATEDHFEAVVTRILGRLANEAEAKLAAGASLSGYGWTLDSHGLRVGKQEPVKLDVVTRAGLFSGKVSLWRAEEELPFFSVPVGSLNARLLDVLARRRSSGGERPREGSLGRLLFQKGGLRVHEGGVTQRSIFGDRTLLYSKVRSFQFEAVRQYVNDGYRGTSLSMRFTSGPGGPVIEYGETVQGGDLDLEVLREHVSKVLAGQLMKRLEEGDEIRWGSSARFTQEGLVVWEPKLIGDSVSRLARYEEGFRCVIERGTCALYVGDETEAATFIECSATNFYPGLRMLETLSSRGPRGLRVTA